MARNCTTRGKHQTREGTDGQSFDFWEHVWFSDEAHFDLNGSVNKQNDRWWAAEAPDYLIEHVAHPQRVTVFAAIHATKGIVFCFFDETVNTVRYIIALDDIIIPQIEGRRTSDIDYDIWQQDGASCHVSHGAIGFLTSSTFLCLVTKNFSPPSIGWPACSPDLNPCDSFLWGYLKSKVWESGVIKTKDELKSAIVAAIAQLDGPDRHKITNGVRAFIPNVQKVVDVGGRHRPT